MTRVEEPEQRLLRQSGEGSREGREVPVERVHGDGLYQVVGRAHHAVEQADVEDQRADTRTRERVTNDRHRLDDRERTVPFAVAVGFGHRQQHAHAHDADSRSREKWPLRVTDVEEARGHHRGGHRLGPDGPAATPDTGELVGVEPLLERVVEPRSLRAGGEGERQCPERVQHEESRGHRDDEKSDQ